nr:hypothetical protein BaRGS_030509 [Batillaria attramentaria]
MQILKRELGVKNEKRGTIFEADDDVLMATATPGERGTTLNVDSEDGRLTVGGSITGGGGNAPVVTLRVGSPMMEKDAGRFVCKASVLDSNFRLQVLTADATLSIIDQDGSAVLLLAKEQILEEQQKELEKQEKILQADLQQTQDQNDMLAKSVDDLKKTVETLSTRLDALDGAVKTLSNKLNGAELEASLRSSFLSKQGGGDADALEDVKKQLDRLEKTAIADLEKKITSIENHSLNDITSRLDSLEGSVSDMQSSTKKTDSGGKKPDKETEEALKMMGGRIDAILNDVITPLRQKVDSVERDDLDKLDTRVKTVEEELPRVRGVVENLQKTVANLTDIVHTRPGPARVADTTRKCHVCGDVASNKPCTVDELRANTMKPCSSGELFCMNDIFQEGSSRKIYKRAHNARNTDCASFNFMSYGNFRCHYCCTEDLCNVDYKPTRHLIDQ